MNKWGALELLVSASSAEFTRHGWVRVSFIGSDPQMGPRVRYGADPQRETRSRVGPKWSRRPLCQSLPPHGRALINPTN